MKVLVTGSAGFIGSHVSEALLKRGVQVVGIDDLNDYYDPAKKVRNNNILLQFSNYHFYKIDITQPDAVDKVFAVEHPTHVIHLAARAGVRASIQQPELYTKVNVLATLSLLQAAARVKVQHFIHTSSSSVYGSTAEVPFHEDQRTDKPVSPYAVTKKASELIAYTMHKLNGMPVTVIRPFTVYGPRGRPDMAPYAFMRRILSSQPIERYGDGSTSRDYTYIGDIVPGILAALERPRGFQIYNLGHNEPVRLNDFIATLERVTGRKAIIIEKPIPTGELALTCADITKAKKELGYSPRTSIAEGLALFHQWFIDNES